MEQNETIFAIDSERELEENIVVLQERITFLIGEEKRLKECLAYEQSDVDAMEGRTLKSAFYTLIGKKDEKLDQEYREVDEAKAAYEAVVVELGAVRKELNRADYALRQFRRSQKEEKQEFDELLASVKSRLDSLSLEVKREFLRLEQELMTHTEQEERILVAIEEGKKAIRLSEHVAEAIRQIESTYRRGYSLEEYELRREEAERRKMMGIQQTRFSDALMQVDFGSCKISSLKNLENLVSPMLGELNELLKQHREKQLQLKDRIKKLIGEEGSF